MAFECRILADSIAPSRKRLTTFCVTYPRIIHSEVLTHRMLTRSSASSRAIPTEKLIQRVLDDPFVPLYLGKNQKGMQAGEELDEASAGRVRDIWLGLRDQAVEHARRVLECGAHKQVVNRLIEPWMWITVIISATELDNFFGLRCHKDAEPHFQHIAGMMREARQVYVPREMPAGAWHLPLWGIDDDWKQARALAEEAERAGGDEVGVGMIEIAKKVSVGRCARVSYLTHDGRRDLREDIALHDRLVVQQPLHASPAEHVAQALEEPERHGNFIGWKQYRKFLPNECIGEAMSS